MEGWGSGPIVVEVEFSETEILSVTVVSHTETPGLSDGALEQVPSQIVAYQTLMVDAVSGATITVEAIVDAVIDAVEQASGDVDALMLDVITRVAGDPIYVDVDVVVIGAGGAGLSSAIIALEEGADVLVLEKTSAPGGNTLAAGAGTLAWNAVQPDRIAMREAIPGQTAFLEGFLDYDPADFAPGFDEALVILQEQITEFLAEGDASAHFDTLEFHLVQTYTGSIRYELDDTRVYSDYDLARIMVYYSYEALQWIEELGGEFRDGLIEPGGAMWTRGAAPYTNNQVDIFDPMVARIDELGGDIMLNTTAEELIVEDGAVVGVTGTQADGTPVTVNAGSVIIATGGFAANTEMVAYYNNFWENFTADILTTNVSSAQGEGIIMAQAAGADVTQMGITQLMPMAFEATGQLAGGHQRGIVYLNEDGERFMNEVNERDTIGAAMFAQGGTVFELRRVEDAIPSHVDMAGDDTGRVFLADTVAEVAELAGLDPDVVVAEVERFNEFAAAGYDEDFGRVVFDNDLADGPFIIRVLSPSTHYTNGGLITTTDARVLGVDGEVIPNLFAAGEVMGGIHGGNRLGGNAVAEAFVFGRIAGEMAAINAQ
ncbi:MAG: FAD-dependent oxidoreductase [Turicibacter sp.]|nr:FAD-dependent oxidoreductase [Turicibacter sp.]